MSPLTTLVNQVIAGSGASSDEAGVSGVSRTASSVSLFKDYTKASAPVGGADPAKPARMLVVTTQQLSVAVESAIGTNSADDKGRARAGIDRATARPRRIARR